MDNQKNELIYGLFLKLLEDLKRLSDRDKIEKGDIDNIVKSYEKKLRIVMNKGQGQEPSLKIRYGESYLVDEEKPVEGFNIFRQAVSRGSNGLCITRTNPESISLYDNLKNVRFIWLSKVGFDNRQNISYLQPSDLTMVANSINDFVKNNPRSVVFLEGIELLNATNGFQNLIRALTTIKDMISSSKSILLVSTNLKALKEDEKNFLLREFNQIPVP